jgi:hypothetical protein
MITTVIIKANERGFAIALPIGFNNILSAMDRNDSDVSSDIVEYNLVYVCIEMSARHRTFRRSEKMKSHDRIIILPIYITNRDVR